MKSITDALGLTPLDEIKTKGVATVGEIVDVIHQPLLPSTIVADEVIADIETAKQNILDLTVQGKNSLDILMNVAASSQNARDFEVVATLMKTLLDANKDFVGMSEKKKYAKEDQPTNQTNIVNNNLILSTTDLLKMLKDKANE